jgi:excisionase family DNA binding protein
VTINRQLDSPARLLLSMQVVAERLSIGKTLAWQLVSSGALASVQIGKRRLVSVAELERYAERLAAQPSGRRPPKATKATRKRAASSRPSPRSH